MITLITGTPGDGKTLYSLNMVKALAEKEGRQVFYSGIRECAVPSSIPWIEFGKPSLDPEKPWNTQPEEWYDLPAGSIIVIDEMQRAFRPRGQGAAVPKHVAELETHRHKGHDLFLITQHPMLADTNVRRFVGRHFHCKRKFGAPASTVHEWSQVNPNPDQLRKDSIRHEFIFPKAAYSWYRSAEVHTHRLRIPMRLWFMLALPLVIAGLVYGVVHWFAERNKPKAEQAHVVQADARTSSGQGGAGRAAGSVRTAAELFKAYQPRIEGLAFTAPRYDAKTAPVAVPYPAACIATKARCQCYSQQATILDVGIDYCRQIVAKGYFLDFDPGKPMQDPASRGEGSERVSYLNPLPAEQAGNSASSIVASPARHTAPPEERSGDGWEGWRTDVRSSKPFVGPFEGVAGR